MKKCAKYFRKYCWFFVLIVLSLTTIVISPHIMPANALKKYGYEKGEEYRFVIEMSTTIKTDEGTTSSSQTYEVICKIKDVEEDTDGYDIKIDLIVMGAVGFYPGFYGYGSLVDETTIEGNKLMSGGVTPMSGFFNLFTSTDWSDREEEWEEFVEEIDKREGYKVTDDSALNGIFSLQIELDVDDDDATAIDYDGDGNREGYTGWWSIRGEYDSKGVLRSSSWETYMEFNKRNSIKSSLNVYRGTAPGMPSSEMIIYVTLAVVGLIVAFVLGFFVGKSKVPKAPSASATDLPPKPPQNT